MIKKLKFLIKDVVTPKTIVTREMTYRQFVSVKNFISLSKISVFFNE